MILSVLCGFAALAALASVLGDGEAAARGSAKEELWLGCDDDFPPDRKDTASRDNSLPRDNV